MATIHKVHNANDTYSDLIIDNTAENISSTIKSYKLPTESNPFYNFSQIFVKGIEVTFTFRWNGEADAYFMDILESYADPKKDNLFISSIPVTEGVNLIEQYEFTMTAILCSRVNANPEIETNHFKELGDSLQVYVVTDYPEV